MWTLIREGSAARDLVRALPFLVSHGTERTALCTDDRNAAALAEHHHLDGVIRYRQAKVLLVAAKCHPHSALIVTHVLYLS